MKIGEKMKKRDSVYKYCKLQYLASTINNGIYASSLNQLNDPYECFNNELISDFRIISLSRSRNQKLMWSHYADGHRGCSIKILLPENYGEDTCDLKRVTYTSEIINRKNMSENEQYSSLYRKDKKWERELEVRAVCNINNLNNNWIKRRGNYYYKVNIDCVYFGCFAQYHSQYLEALIALRDYNFNHKKKIKVRKYKMDDKKYLFIQDKEFDYIKEIAKILNEE